MGYNDDEGRWKALKRVIITLTVLFVLDAVLLLTMIPLTFYTGVLMGMQGVVVLYFAVLSFGLLKRLKKHGFDD